MTEGVVLKIVDVFEISGRGTVVALAGKAGLLGPRTMARFQDVGRLSEISPAA
jgi:hypothetical protein